MRGHSSARKQQALLAHVRPWIPKRRRVVVVGDNEFGAVPLLRQLEQWGWYYVLRQKSSHLVQLADQTTWQSFGSLVETPGQQFWFPDARLTQQHAHRMHLVAYWKADEPDPWLLATNLHTLTGALKAYRRRPWIDEMFGDFKRHGFDLESSHLRRFLRLSRLTLVVVMLYLWMVSLASRVIKQGHRRLVDRANRRDLSIFRIGLSMAERLLANGHALPAHLLLYFT